MTTGPQTPLLFTPIALLGVDPEFNGWPPQYGWWLVRRARSCELYQEDAAPAAE